MHALAPKHLLRRGNTGAIDKTMNRTESLTCHRKDTPRRVFVGHISPDEAKRRFRHLVTFGHINPDDTRSTINQTFRDRRPQT